MANVASFLQSMRRECGDHPPDPVLAMDWLQNRYTQILERAPFQFLSKEGVLLTANVISAGTVTVTLNSATVTESVSNANGWSSSIVDRFFRVRGSNEFYRITAFGDANPDTITLDRAYEAATGTLKTYDIWQRFYSLASDVRYVTSIRTHTDNKTALREVSPTDFDLALTSRPSFANMLYWANSGRDSSDIMQIEIYPTPRAATGLYYRYIHLTPALPNGATTLLPQVSPQLLRAGWLADFWSWRGASDNAPAGALLQSQKYEQEFERHMIEMIARESLTLPPKKIRFTPRVGDSQYIKFAANRTRPNLTDA